MFSCFKDGNTNTCNRGKLWHLVIKTLLQKRGERDFSVHNLLLILRQGIMIHASFSPRNHENGTFLNIHILTPDLCLSHEFCFNVFHTYCSIFANIATSTLKHFSFTLETHMAVRLALARQHKSKTDSLCVCMYVFLYTHVYKHYAGMKSLDSSFVLWVPIKSA